MAAITGLDIVYGRDASAPDGYKMIKENLNEGTEGRYVNLCYSTRPDIGTPITNIQVVYGTTSQDCNQGFTVIGKDLNKGAGGANIYISYARGTTVPITAVDVIFGYDISPSKEFVKIYQNCNEGNRGNSVFICYKY